MKNTKPRFELSSVDDLFTTQEMRDDAKLARINEIDIDLIDEFPEHPFKVKDDDDMQLLVESIKENGVLTPATVRKKEDGRYEMLSGHRRMRACKILGMDKLRCEVVDLDRDDAIILMCDSNLQRSKILPSEKAFSYKMKMDAMNRQGHRSDLTSTPLESKFRTNEEIGKASGESREQVRRYIRLTELIPEILALVDEGRIALRPAVEISYFPRGLQEVLLEKMEIEDCTPTHDQTIRMRKLLDRGELNPCDIYEIMQEPKPNQVERISFRSERLNSVLPKGLPSEKREDFIIEAIEHYRKVLEKRAREKDHER